jgi:MATE family multidrug resistance protein
MGQPDIVVEMAKPYLDIVAFSLVPYYFQAQTIC